MRPAVPEGNAYAKPPEFINIDYSNPSECNRWVTLPNGDRACISKWWKRKRKIEDEDEEENSSLRPLFFNYYVLVQEYRR